LIFIHLVKYASHLSVNALIEKNILLLNYGQIAEQFVGQELIAHQPFYKSPELFFWEKSSKIDSAEVYYVTYVDSHIIPMEVKAGKTGRLKSLNTFIREKNVVFGIKVSQNHFAWEKNILSLPLYLLSEIERLSQSILQKIT
jgi:hypothetical protein